MAHWDGFGRRRTRAKLLRLFSQMFGGDIKAQLSRALSYFKEYKHLKHREGKRSQSSHKMMVQYHLTGTVGRKELAQHLVELDL